MFKYLTVAVLLFACTPGVIRYDCTDTAVWKDNCSRTRLVRTIVDDSCMRGCKPPRPNSGNFTTASAVKGDVQ